MLKYSKYLLLNIVSKKALWLLLILTIGVSILINFLQIHEYIKRDFKFTASINTYTKMIPFIFGVAFMSMIIVYVFKEGETDGTELMIASKPLSRKDILFGKFFVVGIAIIILMLFNFSLYLGIAQYDTLSSGSSRFRFALSISIGGTIVLIIVSMLLILISSFIGRMGTVALGIVAAAIFPIASDVVAGVSKGRVGDKSHFSTNMKILNMKSVDELIEKQAKKYKDDPDNYELSLSDLSDVKSRQYQPATIDAAKEFKKYESEVWYQNVVYGDFWYQWNKFYDIFTGDNPLMGQGPMRWKIKHDAIVALTDDEALVTSSKGNKKGTVVTELSTVDSIEPSNIIDMFIEIMSGWETPIYSNVGAINDKNEWISNSTRGKDGLIAWDESRQTVSMVNGGHDMIKKTFGTYPVIDTFLNEKFSLEARMRGMIAMVHKDSYEVVSWVKRATTKSLLLYKIVRKALETNGAANFARELGASPEDVKKVEDVMKIYFSLHSNKHYQKPNTIRGFSSSKTIEAIVNKNINNNAFVDSKNGNHHLTKADIQEDLEDIYTYAIVEDGDKQTIIVSEPFIKKNNILYIWAAIGVLLVGLTVWRYSRR
ncbi:MAG: ABC transporter permease, partial [Mycoplasmataceae bacterium]|nr:ABC transporter permease [Mycoplasmataceae bacterium]